MARRGRVMYATSVRQACLLGTSMAVHKQFSDHRCENGCTSEEMWGCTRDTKDGCKLSRNSMAWWVRWIKSIPVIRFDKDAPPPEMPFQKQQKHYIKQMKKRKNGR